MKAESLQERFLALWESINDDDPMADFERANMLAHAHQTPELKELVRLVSPKTQADITLRLTGGDIVGHTTSPIRFGEFVKAFAETIKDASKELTGRFRAESDLRVEFASGSIIARFIAPEPKNDVPEAGHQERVDVGQTAESEALRLIANLFEHAAADPNASSIGVIPKRSMGALRRALNRIVDAGWDLESTYRQGYESASSVRVPNQSLALILNLVKAEDKEITTRTIRGKLDGHRESISAVWIEDLDTGEIIRTDVKYDPLLRRARAFAAQDAFVEAQVEETQHVLQADEFVKSISRELISIHELK